MRVIGGNAAAARRGLPPNPLLLSDPRRLPDPSGAARRLPRGAGVLARGVAPALLPGLVRLCRAGGLRLLISGDGRLALRWRAGLHLPDRRPAMGVLPFLGRRRAGGCWALLSVAAHGRAGLARARRLGADFVLLSPVFPTASHPGAPALGLPRFLALARGAGRPVLALGGMTGPRARRLPRWVSGFAAIGGLS